MPGIRGVGEIGTETLRLVLWRSGVYPAYVSLLALTHGRGNIEEVNAYVREFLNDDNSRLQRQAAEHLHRHCRFTEMAKLFKRMRMSQKGQTRSYRRLIVFDWCDYQEQLPVVEFCCDGFIYLFPF